MFMSVSLEIHTGAVLIVTRSVRVSIGPFMHEYIHLHTHIRAAAHKGKQPPTLATDEHAWIRLCGQLLHAAWLF